MRDQPQQPEEWIDLARRELENTKRSYIGSLTNDAKIDHAILAVEAALKAIIWKAKGWSSWPKHRKSHNYLYKHNLEAMLDAAELRQRLRADEQRFASWQVIVNAVQRKYRYHARVPSDDVANEVCKAVRHPDVGVVPWLLERYQEI